MAATHGAKPNRGKPRQSDPVHVGPGELAAQLALLSHVDKGDARNQVRLMDLHGAKGLEFRYVFIVGVEDGTLPHEASIEEGSLKEERCLLYVGITRAKERLWLSYSKKAQKWGDTIRLKPSCFLDELPPPRSSATAPTRSPMPPTSRSARRPDWRRSGRCWTDERDSLRCRVASDA